jgi:5-methylcytosine-specific restriction endonuclease McrA
MVAARKKTTERGLGWRHKQRALQLKNAHVEGTPCWWCGEPMYVGQGLHADHSTPRSVGGPNTMADRLLHGVCNLERGDGRNDDRRPALTGKSVNARQQVLADLGTRAMPWP